MWRLFVRAKIQSADGHTARGQRGQYFFISFKLHFLRGEICLIPKQKLTAQKPNALGITAQRRRRFYWLADVGAKANIDTIGRGGGFAMQQRKAFFLCAQRGNLFGILQHRVVVRF
ncbi:hypothetical protein SDC9_146274 [bioreactor metagenome]|uniref:Uncharacterized protein n=1 Tax=bioreactor metagenome TaxID=1076179 RepID=A0A645EAL8_9ZZZZ